jgi:hypothetical protein
MVENSSYRDNIEDGDSSLLLRAAKTKAPFISNESVSIIGGLIALIGASLLIFRSTATGGQISSPIGGNLRNLLLILRINLNVYIVIYFTRVNCNFIFHKVHLEDSYLVLILIISHLVGASSRRYLAAVNTADNFKLSASGGTFSILLLLFFTFL